jgi:hypothetical protein
MAATTMASVSGCACAAMARRRISTTGGGRSALCATVRTGPVVVCYAGFFGYDAPKATVPGGRRTGLSGEAVSPGGFAVTSGSAFRADAGTRGRSNGRQYRKRTSLRHNHRQGEKSGQPFLLHVAVVLVVR